jgi:hypothetical protein
VLLQRRLPRWHRAPGCSTQHSRVTVVRRGASHRLQRWHRASSFVPHGPSQSYSGAQGCFSSSSSVASCSWLCSTEAFAEMYGSCGLQQQQRKAELQPVLPGGGCSSSQVGMVCARRGAATLARHPLPTFMVAPRLALMAVYHSRLRVLGMNCFCGSYGGMTVWRILTRVGGGRWLLDLL